MPDNNELNAFTFFRSYYEAARELPDKQRLALYDAIIKYGIEGEETDMKGIVKSMFTLIKPNLTTSRAKARAGSKGGKSKREEDDEQPDSNPEAEQKQNGSRSEADGEQPASDKDKDKGDRSVDEEQEEDTPPPTPASGGAAPPEPVPFKRIMEFYNATCTRLRQIKTIDGKRKQAVAARYKTYGFEPFMTLFTKARDSEFLNGNNQRNWSADFDWLVSATNMSKVLEGKYDNDNSPLPPRNTPTAGNRNGVDALGILDSIINGEEGRLDG